MFRFSKHCSYEDIFITGAEFVHFPIAMNSVQGKVTHCSIVLDVFKYKATPCNANFAGCFSFYPKRIFLEIDYSCGKIFVRWALDTKIMLS